MKSITFQRNCRLSLSPCALVPLWFILALIPGAAGAQGTWEGMAGQINAILSDSALKGGIQGVIVRSLKDGSTWYERNSDLYFMPASNQKLLTTSVALALLGPDFRFRTRLYVD